MNLKYGLLVVCIMTSGSMSPVSILDKLEDFRCLVVADAEILSKKIGLNLEGLYDIDATELIKSDVRELCVLSIRYHVLDAIISDMKSKGLDSQNVTQNAICSCLSAIEAKYNAFEEKNLHVEHLVRQELAKIKKEWTCG